MRPTLIPDEEVGTIEGSTRASIMPPNFDFDSGVSAVEVLRHDGPFGAAISLRIELEDEDLERIARGERVWWLTWNSSVLVPFSLTWPNPVEVNHLRAGTEHTERTGHVLALRSAAGSNCSECDWSSDA